MSGLVAPVSTGLESLAREIRDEHEASEHHARFAVDHAINCGKLLTEAKSKLDHGAWLPWLAENFPATRGTAAGYMRLAREENVQRVAHLPIREALAEVADPRDSAPEDEPEVVDGEVIEPRPRRSPDGPVHHLPDVVADDAEQNLRTQALHWFEQGAHIKELLDHKRPLEPRSTEDRKAIKREALAMERVAHRIKEAVSG